ncbi:MAG: hypothetical protein JWM97_3063 [Phycisphaerales bacterium]|nr:hypothetical protein [Phycisphaerales bacterium]
MRGHANQKGLALIAMFAAAVLLGAAAARGADEQRQLDELIQSLKQKGVPILPADFSTKPVPSADDAAPALLAAAKRIELESKVWKDLDQIEERLPASPHEAEVYHAIVTANAQALTLSDQALVRKGADWKVTVTSPVVHVLLPHLHGQRSVAHLLRVAALDAYARGDHRQAVERVRQLLALGRLIDRQPFLVSHLVAIGVGSMTCDCISQMTPDLQIESANKPDPKAATAGQMRALLADLLDENALGDGLKIALQSERMCELDTAGSLISGAMSWEELTGAVGGGKDAAEPQDLKSVALRDAKTMSDQMALVEIAARSADYPTFLKQKPPAPQGLDQAPLAKLLMPAMDRALLHQFRALTERRLAATELAVRWYAVDSDGKFPARLADLSPRYLPAILSDPMAAKQPLAYKPDAKILYSVGEDGVDGGGDEKPATPGRTGGWFMPDYVIHLTRP